MLGSLQVTVTPPAWWSWWGARPTCVLDHNRNHSIHSKLPASNSMMNTWGSWFLKPSGLKAWPASRAAPSSTTFRPSRPEIRRRPMGTHTSTGSRSSGGCSHWSELGGSSFWGLTREEWSSTAPQSVSMSCPMFGLIGFRLFTLFPLIFRDLPPCFGAPWTCGGTRLTKAPKLCRSVRCTALLEQAWAGQVYNTLIMTHLSQEQATCSPPPPLALLCGFCRLKGS